MLGQYGYNYPLRKRWTVEVRARKGINIEFPASIGESMVSAIRVRSM